MEISRLLSDPTEEEEPISKQLTILIERRKAGEKRKALGHWDLLRKSVRKTIDAVKESDLKNKNVSHGIHHLRKLNHNHSIKSVAFMKDRKEYLTTDGGNVCIFLEDGRKKATYTPEETMDTIIYCSQSNQFVGYTKGDDELFLMNNDFEIISQARNPCKINLAKYNHNTTEFITFGPGYFVCWAFRYGARHLIPRKMNKITFTTDNAFSHLVLEETASRQQRCYLSHGKDVVVYNVFEGNQLTMKKDLHERMITGMTFFNPLKYLITGAKDGSIKVWDNEWYLKMVFVGHTRAITVLCVYPDGPAIVSASHDCTVRVWNLDSCDEVDRAKLDAPAIGMATELNYFVFFTYSWKTVDLWKIQHLFRIHTSIGQRVVAIKQTSHPHHLIRSLVVSRDSSVRLITPPNGEVLTTLLLDPAKGIVDAAYAINEEKLFVVLNTGDILKCSTKTNPITIEKTWRIQNPREACNYLLVYEYVPDFKADAWAAFKRGLATNTIGDNSTQTSHAKTILLGGRKDGHICVFDWDDGRVIFSIDAHGVKGVLSMKANSKQDQLISAGKDNIIKVWRLYPFAEEALAPLMSFYCAHTPVHMTMLKTNLCVAFQDHATATYNIVIYNLKDRIFSMPKGETDRYDHQPDDDHTDSITGLTSCQRMKLYASSSLDGTIRIWDETNNLIRLLKLKTMPYSVGFCSERGDLLVGISHHLYKIPYTEYLPKSYIFKMVSMRFADPKPESPFSLDENQVNKLSKREYTRLKKSHSSFKYNQFEDILTKEEEEEVKREQRIKEEAFSKLKAREDELLQIKDSLIKADRTIKVDKKKKEKKDVHINSEAFINYFKMYYDKERPQVPPENPYALEDFLSRGVFDDAEDHWKPEREPTGFFPPINKASRPVTATEEPLMPAYQSATSSGFVPNSVLVKILWPPPPKPEKSQESWRPPSLSQGQIDEIEKEKHRWARLLGVQEPEEEEKEITVDDLVNADEEEHVLIIDDWADEKSPLQSPVPSSGTRTPAYTPPRKEVTFSRQPTVHVIDTPPKSPTPPSTSRQSSLMSRFNEMMTKKEEEKDDDESTVTMTPRSPIETEPSGTLKSPMKSTLPEKPPSEPKPPSAPPPRKEIKSVKPVVKYTKPSPPSEPLPPKPRPVAPQREPTPPRPETPLPGFVTQFKGAEWFEKFFPDAGETNIPKPWTADNFMMTLSRLLRIAEYMHKIAVTDAMAMIYTQEDIGDGTVNSVSKHLIGVLNNHKDPPTCLVEEQKNFIISALRAMSKFGVKDKEFVTELMVQFLDGDKEVRMTVTDLLSAIGLQDPQKFFPKELDSWDIWNVEEEDRKGDLRKMCQQWLDRWMTSYKLHLTDTIERMTKGQNIHGRVRGGGKSRGTPPPSSRSILKKPSIGGGDLIPEDQETITTLPEERNSRSKSITVTFDKPPDPALIDTATCIDAINYFCDMMMEKALESLKRGGRKPPGAKENVVQAKNTVLVLPKLPHKPALVRLGETHTSTCRPQRETNLHVDYRYPATTARGNQPAPGDISHFTPSINLPMKTLYINPFPSAIDALMPSYQEPILITLKSSQKYFIHNQSYLPSDPAVAPAH
ncbi:WD repeat-containing protein 97-like isoform X2 [Ostrea edulis]|uniref:WD repeat-containing protein 97-like isoform X2 n=1 Tax=Ostrea edulis TaxID=37623 RepID=UPI0024AEEAD6|nr:WD repeat-containing protein 97-like isoform X2 [Ostrea edulis]